jgi:hypothetical protein
VQLVRFKIIYLWFGLPVLFAILWFLAFYMPVSSFIVKQRGELSAAQRTREEMGNTVRDVLEARTKDAQARLSIDRISKNMPMYHQFPSVIKAVVGSGKNGGIAFDSLNSIVLPNDSHQIPSLIKPALDMGLKGRFLDMCKFLEEAGQQKGYKRIAEARVTYTDKDYPVLTGKFLIEFRAWKED